MNPYTTLNYKEWTKVKYFQICGSVGVFFVCFISPLRDEVEKEGYFHIISITKVSEINVNI
jgi:hypothetical protein